MACSHNTMVSNDERGYAWRCADCGYVYGKVVDLNKKYRVTVEQTRFWEIEISAVNSAVAERLALDYADGMPHDLQTEFSVCDINEKEQH